MKNYFYRLYLNTEYDDSVIKEIVDYSHFNDDLINDEDVAYYENELFDMDVELIGGNTEFPTKDRRKGERRREDRENHINRRKAIYRNRLVGKVRKGDCDAWLPYKYEEHYPEGQLADGKGKVFEGDSKFARSFKKINPSWNEEKTDANARETLKEFYKSEGNLSYESINDSDWEYDEGWCDLEYEQEYRLEAEREMMLDEIRNVKTVAQAVYLAARFGEEIEWNAMCEYGSPDYANLYREGVELLAEEMIERLEH